MPGTFLIDRDIFKHPLVGMHKPKYLVAWLWMLSEAQWKPIRKDIGGQIVTIERGQFAHSLRFMAKATKLSVQQMRTFISKIECEKMITKINTGNNNGLTLITICNYEAYQDYDEYRNMVNNKRITSEQQANNKRATQTKHQTNPRGTPEEPQREGNKQKFDLSIIKILEQILSPLMAKKVEKYRREIYRNKSNKLVPLTSRAANMLVNSLKQIQNPDDGADMFMDNKYQSFNLDAYQREQQKSNGNGNGSYSTKAERSNEVANKYIEAERRQKDVKNRGNQLALGKLQS